MLMMGVLGSTLCGRRARKWFQGRQDKRGPVGEPAVGRPYVRAERVV